MKPIRRRRIWIAAAVFYLAVWIALTLVFGTEAFIIGLMLLFVIAVGYAATLAVRKPHSRHDRRRQKPESPKRPW